MSSAILSRYTFSSASYYTLLAEYLYLEPSIDMIKKIAVTHLLQGMYISTRPDNSDSIAIAEQGFVLRQETVDKLVRAGVTEVFIDTDKGKDSSFAFPVVSKVHQPTKRLDDERRNAEKTYRSALKTLNQSMTDLRSGSALDVASTETIANEICASVLKNQNALMVLSQIREKSQYLLQHSINVSILMAVWSQYLGYETETRRQMVKGALYHDIGKVNIPIDILDKPAPLDDNEWNEMKSHVHYGTKILSDADVFSDIAIDMCKLHHERLDGSGYPLGLKGDEINVYGRMIAIADTFDAVTSERVYKHGISPSIAMKRMMEWANHGFDKNLVYEFIRCFGIYPVGTLVELDNNRLGIVIVPNLEKPDRPFVKTIYNMKVSAYEEIKEIDLSVKHTGLSIVGTHNPRDHNIAIGDFI